MQKQAYKIEPPDRKRSCFKVKIYFTDGGETSLYSYDYEHERKYFEVTPAEIIEGNFKVHGHQIFAQFNGLKRMVEFVTKVHEQGRLKMAIIYANRLPVQGPSGDSWGMEVVKIVPPKQ